MRSALPLSETGEPEFVGVRDAPTPFATWRQIRTRLADVVTGIRGVRTPVATASVTGI